jgi:hypothetical protein
LSDDLSRICQPEIRLQSLLVLLPNGLSSHSPGRVLIRIMRTACIAANFP